jgi:pimeloyl-ACP methyl ester carboxylesterase
LTTVNVNHTLFEYLERGRGEPVLFVHGSASDYRTWQVQLDEFGKRFRAIAYSRRYHWPNEPIPEGADYSMVEHVDDLRAFLTALDAAPAHLVGHSYGAFLCLLLAMREPRLVRTLVLAEPPVITLFTSNSPRPMELTKLLVTRPRTAMAIVGFGAKGVSPAAAALKRGDSETALRLFGHAILGSETFERLSESRLNQARANFIRAELLGSGFVPLDVDRVRSIQAPTLLVNGQASPALFHRLVDRLQELLPHASRIEIPGASHIMHEDNAPAYNAEVLSFLARHHEASDDMQRLALRAAPEPQRQAVAHR